MSRITIRPAQGHDFHPLQAMSCNGGDGHACYPSFVMSAHKFFVADDGGQVVGFICAYPAQERDQTRFVQMLEPYVYSRCLYQGLEDRLKAAVLEWGEQTLDVHFFKERPFILHPIRPHDYLQSLKYNLVEHSSEAAPETPREPAPQAVSAYQRTYAPA